MLLRKEIEKEMEKFNWLIDEESARMLVMDKLGLIERKKICEVEEGDVAIYAKIESIGRIRKIREKVFLNAIIGDETGHCVLTLWNSHVLKIRYLKEGDVVRIANGFARMGYYGKEINVGKWGNIERSNKKIETKIEFGRRGGIFNLMGVIEKIFPTQIYLGEEERFMAKIVLDGQEIYLLDERAKDIQKFCRGDEIKIYWAYERNGRIYATDFSRIEGIENNKNAKNLIKW